MRIAITGGTGMIGRALRAALEARGDEVVVLTRGRPAAPHEAQWSHSRGVLDLSVLHGVEAVVHLSGAPIAARPWTRARRAELYESRVDAARALLGSLQLVDAQVHTFLGPGGLGYFGDRGDEWLDDESVPGAGFLAELAQTWERSHLATAEALGARGGVLRMSVVLDPFEQTFPIALQPFRLGIGGWLGDGSQYFPWITTRDCVAAFLHVLDTPSISGGINATAPVPSTNREWSEAFGRALERKVRTHAPEWVLRGAFGEFADGLFLSSVRAVPRKLTDSGFIFQDADVDTAFRWLVDAWSRGATAR